MSTFQPPELDHCKPNPCQHGGDCVETDNGFKCHCQAQYQGLRCEGRSPKNNIVPRTCNSIDDKRMQHVRNQDGIKKSGLIFLSLGGPSEYIYLPIHPFSGLLKWPVPRQKKYENKFCKSSVKLIKVNQQPQHSLESLRFEC